MLKKIAYGLVVGLIFAGGLGLLFYPLVSNQVNEYRHRKLIESYVEQVAQAPDADYSQWFEAADAYNRGQVGKSIPDAFAAISDEEDAEYLAQLSLDPSGVMAYLSIPRISVSLPIYHGTSPETLEKGVGHLQGSSLPVGGESTHAVLSAHRGLPSATLFTDLDMLEEGDHFYIYVLDRILAYEVDQIQVVEPDHTEGLAVQPGEDLVTLVTCTPYGVNTHRLLVRGHRGEYVPEVAQEETKHTVSSTHTRYGLWAGGGLAAAALFSLLLYGLTRRKRKKTKRNEG